MHSPATGSVSGRWLYSRAARDSRFSVVSCTGASVLIAQTHRMTTACIAQV